MMMTMKKMTRRSRNSTLVERRGELAVDKSLVAADEIVV